jgi:hypothetical protein
MCSPWKDDWLPDFQNLEQLQDWCKPYLEEESVGEFSGMPQCREVKD